MTDVDGVAGPVAVVIPGNSWRARLTVPGWAVVTGAVGAAVMLLARDRGSSGAAFTGTPQFVLFVAFIVGLWAAVPVLWKIGWELLDQLGVDARQLLRERWLIEALAVVVLVVADGVIGGVVHRPLATYYLGWLRVLVTYLVIATALIPLAQVFFVSRHELLTLRWGPPPVSYEDQLAAVNTIAVARRTMLAALTTVGAVLSLGLLATGAQRQAYLSAGRVAAEYPAAYVVAWGLSFSGVLIVLFAPAYRALADAASTTIDRIFPPVAPSDPTWRDTVDSRTALAQQLNVSNTLRDTVNSSILIAAPLVTSALSLFLPSSN